MFRGQVLELMAADVVHAARVSEDQKLASKQWLNLRHNDRRK